MLPGVVVVKSTHLQRGRAANAPVATLDEVASGETIFLLTTLRSFGNDGFEAALRTSKAEVQRLGIEMLDPVFPSLWEGQPALLHVDIGKLPVSGASRITATSAMRGSSWTRSLLKNKPQISADERRFRSAFISEICG